MTSPLSVNGTPLPEPAAGGYSSWWEELTNADRNTLGTLIKYRIATKYNIEVEWKGLSASEKNSLFKLTSANLFSMSFLDMTDGTYHSGTFYRGSSPTIEGFGAWSGGEFEYYNVKMSFIEQ